MSLEGVFRDLCPVCGVGRLFAFWDLNRRALYLHCEECEQGFRDPEKVSRESGFLTLLEDFESRSATSQEIHEHGWDRFLIDSGERDV